MNRRGLGAPWSEPPAQTLTVWRGLERGRRPARTRRGGWPVRRSSPMPIEGVAYASPFAWGSAGWSSLAIPGPARCSRTATASRDDPIDVGALWESGMRPSRSRATGG